METEHTPAVTTPGRTTFRFKEAEVAEALAEWLAKRGDVVPDGRMHVDPGGAALIVTHPDPPPAREDVDGTN